MPDDPPAEATSNPDEVLIRIWEHCIAAAELVETCASPALHAAMQKLLNTLGREMGQRMRGPPN
ncbi:hypothetical protein [Methylorubrum sp. POS3]|uniref:hypothetical protein n=1 Tax=Methylorubrum sp. POS3 TaxID=2998492 RepID=UPI00372A16E7